jgi:hypothetical protein
MTRLKKNECGESYNREIAIKSRKAGFTVEKSPQIVNNDKNYI